MENQTEPIIVYTKYSKQEFQQFARCTFHSFGVALFVIIGIIMLSILINAAAGVVSPYGLSLSIFLNIFPLFIIALFFILFYLMMSKAIYPEKTYEKERRLFRNGQTCYFRPGDFSVSMEIPEYKADTSMHYSLLYKIVETPEMFLLYTNRNSAYLVSKEGIQNAAPGLLRQILQQNVQPGKYKFYKKSKIQ